MWLKSLKQLICLLGGNFERSVIARNILGYNERELHKIFYIVRDKFQLATDSAAGPKFFVGDVTDLLS